MWWINLANPASSHFHSQVLLYNKSFVLLILSQDLHLRNANPHIIILKQVLNHVQGLKWKYASKNEQIENFRTTEMNILELKIKYLEFYLKVRWVDLTRDCWQKGQQTEVTQSEEQKEKDQKKKNCNKILVICRIIWKGLAYV